MRCSVGAEPVHLLMGRLVWQPLERVHHIGSAKGRRPLQSPLRRWSGTERGGVLGSDWGTALESSVGAKCGGRQQRSPPTPWATRSQTHGLSLASREAQRWPRSGRRTVRPCAAEPTPTLAGTRRSSEGSVEHTVQRSPLPRVAKRRCDNRHVPQPQRPGQQPSQPGNALGPLRPWMTSSGGAGSSSRDMTRTARCAGRCNVRRTVKHGMRP
mmetsp:Transcript_55658/g.178588  ORF Transcript_55658/g.178588 Transcript_55658/m.178588 type:complete len:212 (+) Transcript_55658:137-772(+)